MSIGEAEPLGELLATWYASGARAWPRIHVSRQAFDEFVTVRVNTENAAAARPHGADFYVACACAAGDIKAITDFGARYLDTLRDRLRRIDPSREFHDDVIQTVRERLMVGKDGQPPLIVNYKGRGPLESWVAVTVLRAAVRLQQASHVRPQRHSSDAIETAINPELEYAKQRYRRQFEDALREALATLSGRSRQLLRMRYVECQSVNDVSARYRVHRATAARWIAAAEHELLADTRRRLRERLRMGETELVSLSRAMVSQMDVSLSALVDAPWTQAKVASKSP